MGSVKVTTKGTTIETRGSELGIGWCLGVGKKALLSKLRVPIGPIVVPFGNYLIKL